MKSLLNFEGASILSKQEQRGIKGGNSGNCGPQIPTCYDCPQTCAYVQYRGTSSWCCPGNQQ